MKKLKVCGKMPQLFPKMLFKEKNDAMVELTLPKDANIFASQYELYLPDKKLLQQKLEEWFAEETDGEEQ